MMTDGHVAIVTGANHGIGAATAEVLARQGCAVLCTYWRLEDPPDPGTPQAYRDHRAQGAEPVIARIQAAGWLTTPSRRHIAAARTGAASSG